MPQDKNKISKLKFAKGVKHYKAGPARRAAAMNNKNLDFSSFTKKPDSLRKRLLKKLLYLGFISSIWGGIVLLIIIIYFSFGLPSIENIASVKRKPSITILDVNEEKITSIDDLYGNSLNLKSLPPYVWQAIVATEDHRFFKHHGIDFMGLTRAMYHNLRAGYVVQGGSTLTQQLAKNIFLSRERTVKRKIQEMLLAFWLEMRFSKEQILSLYLNRVSLVNGQYGIDIASEKLFGKSVNQMTLYEAALIAAMLKAPTKYNPVKNPKETHERAKIVLNNMIKEKYITKDQAINALSAPHVYSQTKYSSKRYFTDFVLDELNSRLGNIEEDVVIHSTLDLNMQNKSEQVLDTYLNKYGKNQNISEGAMLFMNNNGGIKVMVGGHDYVNTQFNRTNQAKRQPGSLFKPFVYLAALENGYTPTSVIEDRPVKIGDWAPENYNEEYVGNVTLRAALSRSINTATVILAQDLGISKVIKTAKRLGVGNNFRRDLSIVLGTNETTLMDITSAFAVFANNGYAVNPYSIETITNKNGDMMYKRQSLGEIQLVKADPLYNLNEMLYYVISEGTGKKASLANIGITVRGKTGTTQDSRDAWFIGYTDKVTGGVWLGNDNNDPMNKVTGGAIPAEMWRDVMAWYYGK